MVVPANSATHNANGVGFDKPFVPGFYYEVVVERSDRGILPAVHVWEDSVNTVIPGTLIPSGDWVELASGARPSRLAAPCTAEDGGCDDLGSSSRP